MSDIKKYFKHTHHRPAPVYILKMTLPGPEIIIKMSSVMPFTFNAVELCIVTVNEKPWAGAREVCRVVEYGKATKAVDVVKHLCSKTNYAQKCQLIGFVSEMKPVNWQKDLQKHDIYISEEGMYELVFSSQQPKAKDFRRHCFNVMFTQIQRQLTNKMKEEHQQAIKEKKTELPQCDNQIQALEFRKEEHQHKILRLNEEIDDLIAKRHVGHCECFDSVLCFIKKNSGEVHPYFINQCQYRQLEKHK